MELEVSNGVPTLYMNRREASDLISKLAGVIGYLGDSSFPIAVSVQIEEDIGFKQMRFDIEDDQLKRQLAMSKDQS
jgi:hypothetical protein